MGETCDLAKCRWKSGSLGLEEQALGIGGGEAVCLPSFYSILLYILYSKLSYMMRRLYPAKDAELGNQRNAQRLCLSPFSYSG